MKQRIESAIFETISDINKWNTVLKLLVEATGASKSILSLRDRLTAELVIPDNVSQELGSPLVYGFSEQEIHSYITHYIEHDPWTEIENKYHPDEPYALSTHVSLNDLKQSQFWEWLEPQGINDTIVFKIGDSSSRYWVAMNFYYLKEDGGNTQEQILEMVSEFQSIMNNAWNLGQKMRLSHVKSSQAEYFIEQQRQPTFLISSDKKVLQKNQKAQQLLHSSDSPFYLSSENTLRCHDSDLKKQLQNKIAQLEKNHITQLEATDEHITHQGKHIQMSLIGDAESVLGENTATFLLTLCCSSEKQVVWENPLLTPRERELVEMLAKGKRVVDFQNHYNLSKSMAHKHWTNVKEKLKIKDRVDIYAAHQIYLQNL